MGDGECATAPAPTPAQNRPDTSGRTSGWPGGRSAGRWDQCGDRRAWASAAEKVIKDNTVIRFARGRTVQHEGKGGRHQAGSQPVPRRWAQILRALAWVALGGLVSGLSTARASDRAAAGAPVL